MTVDTCIGGRVRCSMGRWEASRSSSCRFCSGICDFPRETAVCVFGSTVDGVASLGASGVSANVAVPN